MKYCICLLALTASLNALSIISSQAQFNAFTATNPASVDMDVFTTNTINDSDLNTSQANFSTPTGTVEIRIFIEAFINDIDTNPLTVNFNGPVAGFGVIFTSPDVDNVIEFFDVGGNSLGVLSAGGNGNSNVLIDAVNIGGGNFFLGATVDAFEGIGSVQITSSPNGFEIREFLIGKTIPEPSTYLFGLFALGLLYFRKSKTKQ